MASPGTLPARWRELAAAWDPSEGCRGDVARAAIFRLCAKELEASLAGERAGVQELSDAARALADEIEEGDDCDDMITDQLANALMRVRGAVLALGLPPKEEPHADRP